MVWVKKFFKIERGAGGGGGGGFGVQIRATKRIMGSDSWIKG